MMGVLLDRTFVLGAAMMARVESRFEASIQVQARSVMSVASLDPVHFILFQSTVLGSKLPSFTSTMCIEMSIQYGMLISQGFLKKSQTYDIASCVQVKHIVLGVRSQFLGIAVLPT